MIKADKFWRKIEKALARQMGFTSLNPEQAQRLFEELPGAKLTNSEIHSIIEHVTSVNKETQNDKG